LSIDIDKVKDLEPDLVLASLSVPGMERNIEQLQNRNIPHVVFNPNSLEEIAENLLTLGELTGVKSKATEVAAHYRKKIAHYSQLSQKVGQRPTVYWEWWPKPVFTPGRVNWLTEISRLAGAKNVYEDMDVASVQTDWEDVYNRNPEYICLVWVGVQSSKVNPKLLQQRPNWKNLKALRKNHVHVLDEPLFCRPSPRLLEGLQKVAAIIHPTIFPAR
jgi:iron complex transport system substrate-binding protein